MPMITVPMGSMPDADRMGSMCAIPAFMARAATRTSGTKMTFVAEFYADDCHAVEESVVEDVVRCVSVVEALFCESVDFEVFADDELVCDLLHDLVGEVPVLHRCVSVRRVL